MEEFIQRYPALTFAVIVSLYALSLWVAKMFFNRMISRFDDQDRHMHEQTQLLHKIEVDNVRNFSKLEGRVESLERYVWNKGTSHGD